MYRRNCMCAASAAALRGIFPEAGIREANSATSGVSGRTHWVAYASRSVSVVWMVGKLRGLSASCLIRGRSLDMIDDENFNRTLGGHEFQPKLFL
jgi:hypothetical protein